MNHWFSLLVFCFCGFTGALVSAQSGAASDQPTVLLVVGAGGEDEYRDAFLQWAGLWEKNCRAAEARITVVGTDQTQAANAAGNAGPISEPALEKAENSDFHQLKKLLEAEPREGTAELWIVLMGHGTFDGKQAKFNLRGPDLAAEDLGAWLQPFRRPLALINCASSSGPFLPKLSGAGRVIISATKSGYEQNFTRFGKFFTEAIFDTEADLEKDGQTSLLEAYLTACHRVAEFYRAEGRLATEHALLDDNGDGLGTPADWFRGIRATKKASEGATLDGFRAHQFHLVRGEQERRLSPEQRKRRDELEMAIATLRQQKPELHTDAYYQQLEPLLVELARLYEAAGSKRPNP